MATAAAVLVLAVAGCGDDDAPIEPIATDATTETSEGGTIAAEDFIDQADSRCAETNAALASLESSDASATAADQQTEITRELISGLRSIGEPEDPDGSLDAFYRALEEQASVLEQQSEAAASGDTAAFDALALELDQAQEDALDAAQDFGLQECGTEGAALPDSETSTTATPVEPETAAPTEVAPATTTPVEPAPAAPAPTEPAPVEPAPPTGGTGAGQPSGGSSGGSGGSSGGGFSP